MEKPNLHDATLLSLTVRWAKQASVEVCFRDDGPLLIQLNVRGVTLLNCPHDSPWGPSVSVNEVRGPMPADDGTMWLEIEIQSGDTITVRGASFEWAQSSGSEVQT